MEAFPGESFQGKVTRINPAVSQDSRTFEAEALIENHEGRLKPGFFVQASLPSKKEENAIFIPEAGGELSLWGVQGFVVNAIAYKNGKFVQPGKRKISKVAGSKSQKGSSQGNVWPRPSRERCGRRHRARASDDRARREVGGIASDALHAVARLRLAETPQCGP